MLTDIQLVLQCMSMFGFLKHGPLIMKRCFKYLCVTTVLHSDSTSLSFAQNGVPTFSIDLDQFLYQSITVPVRTMRPNGVEACRSQARKLVNVVGGGGADDSGLE